MYRRWMKNITLCDMEVEKHKFHHHQNLILLEDVDIEKIQISSMVLSSKKNSKDASKNLFQKLMWKVIMEN